MAVALIAEQDFTLGAGTGTKNTGKTLRNL